MRNVFAAILFLLLIPLIARAQISANFSGANGGMAIVGESTTTCDSSIEGALRYNSAGGSGGKIEVCDGSAWTEWGQ